MNPDLYALIGLMLWCIFIFAGTVFLVFCILSLIVAPFRVFFALRGVLGRKGFYFAKIFFSSFAALLLFGAFDILIRAGVYCSREDHMPGILFRYIMFQPKQGLAYAAFEFPLFLFKKFTRQNGNPEALGAQDAHPREARQKKGPDGMPAAEDNIKTIS